MALAPALRAHVCDLLDLVGPDAPTLNEGWDARELAAHLAIRDRRLDALPGIALPLLAAHTRRVQARQAAEPYGRTVALVRSGPPAWNPLGFGPLDERANLAEFVIHAEDIRRAQARPNDLPSRPRAAEVDDALWRALPLMARMGLRSCPVGVTARCPGRSDLVLKKPTGSDEVILQGLPLELTLLLSGRRAHAEVEVCGAPGAVAAFDRANPRL